jgi:predicted ribosomally synthesized peptide with nif11-like leader
MTLRRKNDQMEVKDVEALFTRVNDDPELQARFKAIAGETEFDALVAELGFELTYADFTEAASDAELTEEQLADVAGGELTIFGTTVIISGAVVVDGIAAVAKTWN